MGRPMVTRLVEAGHDVQVLGRTAEKRRELEQLGATAMSETAAAGAHADAVVLFVFTDEQVRQACLDSALLPTMPSGSALVVHTTASPKNDRGHRRPRSLLRRRRG
jgi:3-hydroxyisobutyrate dehydrogenase-like beta-hydroxyacid dehydrogenase